MKSIITNTLTFSLIIFILAISCKKEHEAGSPLVISFKIDNGYVNSDTTILIGSNFKIGLIAEKGDANITNFIIKITTDSVQTYLDSGLNSAGFTIDKIFTKGVSQLENWTFIVRDKDGGSASISLNIYADSNSVFGPVITIPSVILGAQNNTTVGSFFDFFNGNTYNLAEAYFIQDSIELCYYYDFLQGEDNVIASPGANIDASVYIGQYGLSNWTIHNETLFLQTSLTDNDFNNINNDSLLIAIYNVPLSKRKAKNLSAGDIYSFKTSIGIFGIFRVMNVYATDAGTVEIMIKMQPY